MQLDIAQNRTMAKSYQDELDKGEQEWNELSDLHLSTQKEYEETKNARASKKKEMEE